MGKAAGPTGVVSDMLFATTRSVVKSVKVSVVYAQIDPTGSAIDPLVTSQLGVWCNRTGVSHLVVKLHRYRCCLVRLTPYACSPAIDGSVLTVVVKECIVLSLLSSVRTESLLLVRHWGWMLLQYSVVSLELSS